MSRPVITEAEVARIISRQKFIYRTIADNTQPSRSEKRQKDYVQPNEKNIVYEIRYSDMREKPADLRFRARLETGISGAPRPRPGISLNWKNTRIRGVNWNLRHDSMLNGQLLEPVRGWHEKLWTEIDEDKYVVSIKEEVRNTDLRSMIRFCCQRWNIDLPEEPKNLLGE
jgi:hypothetical protein